MPYVRISLLKGKSPEYLKSLSDSLHRALVETFEVPADDRFQVIHQHERGELVFDKHYMGGPRSDNYVLICVTAGRQRSTKVKQGFYRHLVNLLQDSPGIRPEDVMVVINTTQADEWSFGSGNSIVPKV
ncbi:tautomerase family protein [Acidithiobacillus thiooxidans]|uniref:tautomerase family protein n=1 Tax=Acidithiobacillus thiooxidans TaxID=930 RepID=UPI001C0749DE|nr:tautomerase family protein [Acidithiobacillus thiooxidans]